MSKINITVGLAYGDEGKGMVTNSHFNDGSNHLSKIGVRFSGGHQAGHNVVLPNGIKHIHSIFASGAISGYESYLTEHCVFCPLSLQIESAIIKSKIGKKPKISIHPFAMLVTPFDIVFNKFKEKYHNIQTSCGQGIGATMERNIQSHYSLRAVDVLHPHVFLRKLSNIQKYYSDKMEEYGTTLHEWINEFNMLEEIDEFKSKYMNDWQLRDYSMLSGYSQINFEGSQGLMLDQNFGIFPEVTYANTTIKNALEVLDHMHSVDSLKVWNCSRAYTTRHGDGYINGHRDIEVGNVSETNQDNENQGKFKVRPLDYDVLNYALKVNGTLLKGWVAGHKELAHGQCPLFLLVITCMDHIPIDTFDECKLPSYVLDDIYYSDNPLSTIYR